MTIMDYNHSVQEHIRIIFELNNGEYNITKAYVCNTLTSIFLSVKHSKFADLYYQCFLCKHWNFLY